MPAADDAARRARFKSWLWRAGIACAIIYPVLVAIWYFTGQGEFWPVWGIYIMGGGLLFLTWGAFAKQAPTADKKD